MKSITFSYGKLILLMSIVIVFVSCNDKGNVPGGGAIPPAAPLAWSQTPVASPAKVTYGGMIMINASATAAETMKLINASGVVIAETNSSVLTVPLLNVTAGASYTVIASGKGGQTLSLPVSFDVYSQRKTALCASFGDYVMTKYQVIVGLDTFGYAPVCNPFRATLTDSVYFNRSICGGVNGSGIYQLLDGDSKIFFAQQPGAIPFNLEECTEHQVVMWSQEANGNRTRMIYTR